MSAIDPIVPGATLLQFRLGDRIGPTVWTAEDTRSGKLVALKILTRQLPKDSFKREALIRDVRLAAALYHSFLVNVLEIVEAGDVLVMAMELVDGQPLSRLAKSKPVDRAEFFRIAYQLVDVVKFLHLRELTHLNINGDSVLIANSGQVKLAGLNVNNLLKREAQTVYQQRAGDARSVAYMSPEQIGGEPMTPSADIWSIGVALYELSTGKLPFAGANPSELAQRIIDGQPSSPKAARPDIDPQVLALMGKCLFKDPYRRHKDAKTMLEEIVKVDPDAAKFANDLVKSGTAAPLAQAAEHDALLFIADIANYDALAAADTSFATKAAARMQQILGESVYLFDGNVVDPFGPRMIAELPSVESAVEAGRKGEFDFSPAQQEGEPLQVRMLLHAGAVLEKDGEIIGAAVDRAVEVIAHVQPMKLFLTEEFLKRGRGTLRLRDAGARGGMKLYQIVDPEPDVVVTLPPEESTAEIEAAEAEAAAADAAWRAAKVKRRRRLFAAVGFGLLAVVAGLAVVFFPRKAAKVQAVATRPAALPPATAATPRKVLVKVDAADPTLAERAGTTALAVTSILATYPELRIADKPAPDVTPFAATLRTGAAGPEIVTGKDAPVPAPDAASAIAQTLHAVATELKLPAREPSVPPAYNAFADAVAANAAHDAAKTDTALRAAIKADPRFLAAQLLAFNFFEAAGKEKDAVEAARQVFALEPSNLPAARRIARASLKDGNLANAFAAYQAVLARDPRDAEALNTFGKYAVAANDEPKFQAALTRLAKLPSERPAVHAPDMLVATGRIEAAIDKYYDVEVNVPRNAALSLKIGRISVLRHSTPIAELELKKLETLDPKYSFHMLKAYIAAQSGAKAEASAQLKEALAASTPGDDYWTSVAEIAAMSNDPNAVMTALETAVARKEPTASYVLTSPLFRYLASDPRFQKVRGSLAAEQDEIRGALANISL